MGFLGLGCFRATAHRSTVPVEASAGFYMPSSKASTSSRWQYVSLPTTCRAVGVSFLTSTPVSWVGFAVQVLF